MPRQTVTQNRQDAHSIAKELFKIQPEYEALVEKREELKTQLRPFGANTYIFDGGVVTVGEPEVRKFTGQTFVLDKDAFIALSAEKRKELIDSGLVKIEDMYSRNAVAKVETKLTT